MPSKIVNGVLEFMGTLDCRYRADQPTLSCTGNIAKLDDWEFRVTSGALTGTLSIGGKAYALPPNRGFTEGIPKTVENRFLQRLRVEYQATLTKL